MLCVQFKFVYSLFCCCSNCNWVNMIYVYRTIFLLYSLSLCRVFFAFCCSYCNRFNMVCVQFKLVYSLFVVPIVTGFFSVLGMAIERFQVREDTHKEKCFFSGRTTKVLPSLHYWLSGPCHFIFFF